MELLLKQTNSWLISSFIVSLLQLEAIKEQIIKRILDSSQGYVLNNTTYMCCECVRYCVGVCALDSALYNYQMTNDVTK